MKFKLKNACVKIIGSMLIAGGVFAVSSGSSHNAAYAGKFMSTFNDYDLKFGNLSTFSGTDSEYKLGRVKELIEEVKEKIGEDVPSFKDFLEEEKDYSINDIRKQVKTFEDEVRAAISNIGNSRLEKDGTLVEFKKQIKKILDYFYEADVIAKGGNAPDIGEVDSKVREIQEIVYKSKEASEDETIKRLEPVVTAMGESFKKTNFKFIGESSIGEIYLDKIQNLLKLSSIITGVFVTKDRERVPKSVTDLIMLSNSLLKELKNAVELATKHIGESGKIVPMTSPMTSREESEESIEELIEWFELLNGSGTCSFEDFERKSTALFRKLAQLKHNVDVNSDIFDKYYKMLNDLRSVLSSISTYKTSNVVCEKEDDRGEVGRKLDVLIKSIDGKLKIMTPKMQDKKFKTGGIETLISSFGPQKDFKSEEEIFELCNEVFRFVANLEDEDIVKESGKINFFKSLLAAMKQSLPKIEESGFDTKYLSHYKSAMGLLEDKVKRMEDLEKGASSNETNVNNNNNGGMVLGQMFDVPVPGQMFNVPTMNLGTSYSNNMYSNNMGMNNGMMNMNNNMMNMNNGMNYNTNNNMMNMNNGMNYNTNNNMMNMNNSMMNLGAYSNNMMNNNMMNSGAYSNNMMNMNNGMNYNTNNNMMNNSMMNSGVYNGYGY